MFFSIRHCENYKLFITFRDAANFPSSIEGYRESALGADFGPKMQVLLTCKTGLEAWRQLLPQCLAMGVPSMWGDNNMNGKFGLIYYSFISMGPKLNSIHSILHFLCQITSGQQRPMIPLIDIPPKGPCGAKWYPREDS